MAVVGAEIVGGLAEAGAGAAEAGAAEAEAGTTSVARGMDSGFKDMVGKVQAHTAETDTVENPGLKTPDGNKVSLEPTPTDTPEEAETRAENGKDGQEGRAGSDGKAGKNVSSSLSNKLASLLKTLISDQRKMIRALDKGFKNLADINKKKFAADTKNGILGKLTAERGKNAPEKEGKESKGGGMLKQSVGGTLKSLAIAAALGGLFGIATEVKKHWKAISDILGSMKVTLDKWYTGAKSWTTNAMSTVGDGIHKVASTIKQAVNGAAKLFHLPEPFPDENTNAAASLNASNAAYQKVKKDNPFYKSPEETSKMSRADFSKHVSDYNKYEQQHPEIEAKAQKARATVTNTLAAERAKDHPEENDKSKAGETSGAGAGTGVSAGGKSYGKSGKYDVDKMWDRMKGNIAQAESGAAGYDAHHGGTIQGLTKKTIGELKHMTGAMGKYQLIPGTTLGEAAKGVGLKDTDLFSAENQEAMGKFLFARRVKAGASGGVAGIQSQLAHEWASLPKDATGAGAYDGDSAGNVASGGTKRAASIASMIQDSSQTDLAATSSKSVDLSAVAKPNVQLASASEAGSGSGSDSSKSSGAVVVNNSNVQNRNNNTSIAPPRGSAVADVKLRGNVTPSIG